MYCCYRGDQSLIEGYGGDLTSSFEERYQFNLGGSFDFVAYLNWLGKEFLHVISIALVLVYMYLPEYSIQ